jgi:very-short-patch-repair endonuclease
MANENARALRKRTTPQEVKLWARLREWRQQGYHFRRQAPRAGAIVDFICLRQRLVIEADGGQHGFDAHARRDAERDGRLAERGFRTDAERGFRTLRFWNADVDGSLDSVVETVWHALQEPVP